MGNAAGDEEWRAKLETWAGSLEVGWVSCGLGRSSGRGIGVQEAIGMLRGEEGLRKELRELRAERRVLADCLATLATQRSQWMAKVPPPSPHPS